MSDEAIAPDRSERITFCLVHPESPGNVGAAARALKNMGFSRLALVSPTDPRGEESIRMAYRSRELLDQAAHFPDLDAALAEAHWVVGLTGREPKKQRRSHTSIEALAPEIWRRAEDQKILLLFGSEGTGLNNEILARCHRTAFIPTGPSFSSLNLAQAVLLTAAALLRTAPADAGPKEKNARRALLPVGALEPLFEEMEEALREIGFLKPPADKKMVRMLRTLWLRAEMDLEEAKILRAMFREVRQASRRKAPER